MRQAPPRLTDFVFLLNTQRNLGRLLCLQHDQSSNCTIKSQLFSQTLLKVIFKCRSTCNENAVSISVQNVRAFIRFLFIFYLRAILTQDAGYDEARQIKVARRKMNLTWEGWWISVTRTQATQRMKIRLRGTTQGIFLYMCLRLTSQSFPRRTRYNSRYFVSDSWLPKRYLQETDNWNRIPKSKESSATYLCSRKHTLLSWNMDRSAK